MHINETRVQAPHETFLAAYDLNIGPPKSKTTNRNGIRENPLAAKQMSARTEGEVGGRKASRH